MLKNEMPRKQEYIRGKLVREFGDFNNYLRDHYSITGSYSKDKNQYIIRKENTYFPTEDFESQLANNENKQTSANTIYNVAVDGNYTSTPNIKAHFSGLFMSVYSRYWQVATRNLLWGNTCSPFGLSLIHIFLR